MSEYYLRENQLASVGEDVFIAPNAFIRRPHLAKVGNHVAIDHGFYCTTSLDIGDYIHIGPYTAVIGGENGMLTLKNFSGISLGCRVVCGSDEYLGEGMMNPMVPDEFRDNLIIKPVVLEEHSCLGGNCTILPGVTLGEGSVVGANSLVTKSTEPWTIYLGTPAKPYKARRSDKILDYAKQMRDRGLVK